MKKLIPTIVVLTVIAMLGICVAAYLKDAKGAKNKIATTNGPATAAHPRFDQ